MKEEIEEEVDLRKLTMQEIVLLLPCAERLSSKHAKAKQLEIRGKEKSKATIVCEISLLASKYLSAYIFLFGDNSATLLISHSKARIGTQGNTVLFSNLSDRGREFASQQLPTNYINKDTLRESGGMFSMPFSSHEELVHMLLWYFWGLYHVSVGGKSRDSLRVSCDSEIPRVTSKMIRALEDHF